MRAHLNQKSSQQIYNLTHQFDKALIIYYLPSMIKFCSRFLFSSIKPYNASKDYYKILLLSQSATQKDIKKSFRELAKKYHPDSNKGKQELFKQVNQAYQVLSDETIKRDYDQQRKLTQRPSSNASQNYQNRSYTQHSNQRTQSNNYRGYERQQGWQNRNFREQFMHDLYRTQQAHFDRNFRENDRAKFARQFRQKLQRATKADINDNIRKYSEETKRRQAQQRRIFEQQQRIRMEIQKQQFRRYKDQTYHDTNDKLKQKLNQVADGIAHNVKDILNMAEQVKNFWNNIKKKK